MIDLGIYYPAVKALHRLLVGLSLMLFVGRWLGVLMAAPWPMRPVVRRASVGIDTLLVCAGLALWGWGRWTIAGSPWLGTKLALLVVYVLLGSWALKRARTWRGHLLFGLGALGVAAYMVGIAVAHHPAGWLTFFSANPFIL
jgi:uncharacterized membrane protein SirB2